MGILAQITKNQKDALVPQGVVAITPSDTVNLTVPIRAFMVGAAGNVSVVMGDGSTGVIPLTATGIQYMGKIARINATLTTATGIIGFI